MPAGDAARDSALAARFEFATAGRIVFGAGCSAELPSLATGLGRRVFLVVGGRPDRFAEQIAALRDASEACEVFSVSGEPTVELADEGANRALDSGSAVVVAIGGGSVIDAGKAIAALAPHEGDALDYLEVVGRGQPLSKPSLPLIAVPTTAGTGSEVTRNAVLAVPAAEVKASLRSPHMLPRVALIDPTLTWDLPPATTAATGMDALTQLIEPYLSARANPLTDALCRDGIQRAGRALPRAFREPHHAAARADMALAALYSGLALANAGLGAVHGFAAPIGGLFAAPHGAVCAALLPHVLAANLAALRARAPQHPALDRFREIARLLSGNLAATADDAVQCCRELTRSLAIPSLASWGIATRNSEDLAAKAARASSMKANPIPLTHAELVSILESALAA